MQCWALAFGCASYSHFSPGRFCPISLKRVLYLPAGLLLGDALYIQACYGLRIAVGRWTSQVVGSIIITLVFACARVLVIVERVQTRELRRKQKLDRTRRLNDACTQLETELSVTVARLSALSTFEDSPEPETGDVCGVHADDETADLQAALFGAGPSRPHAHTD